MASYSQTATITQPSGVLGKRKSRTLVVRLKTDSSYSTDDHHLSSDAPGLSTPTQVLRKYKCTHPGCEKSYTKPSRLAEHTRSHTGDRPFVCRVCNKSYLRDTHLHAHSRTHLPESARPLGCDISDCTKRFWTTQHLREHINWHNGEKKFTCTEPGCNEAFSKHNQLRNHVCSAHAPPGTKPYQCDEDGCSKSFATSQHLRTHSKTHDKNRYTCGHFACINTSSTPRTYFPTWTSLQHHTRTAHPATCSYASCNARVFASQKGLRAHLKLHEQREHEKEMFGGDEPNSVDEETDSERPKKRRRGGEIGRDWKCEVNGCDKEYKSKKALYTHNKVAHLGQRDFICPHSGCSHAFGYKHLLQRHMAKAHASSSGSSNSSSDSSSDDDSSSKTSIHNAVDIEAITGNSYARRAKVSLQENTMLRCPYPRLNYIIEQPVTEEQHSVSSSHVCDYVFSRAYDLTRHLRSAHSVDAQKERVGKWVKRQWQTKNLAG